MQLLQNNKRLKEARHMGEEYMLNRAAGRWLLCRLRVLDITPFCCVNNRLKDVVCMSRCIIPSQRRERTFVEKGFCLKEAENMKTYTFLSRKQRSWRRQDSTKYSNKILYFSLIKVWDIRSKEELLSLRVTGECG